MGQVARPRRKSAPNPGHRPGRHVEPAPTHPSWRRRSCHPPYSVSERGLAVASM